MFSKGIIWQLVACLPDNSIGHCSRDCVLAGFRQKVHLADKTRKGDQKERLFKTCVWLDEEAGFSLVVGNYSVEYRFCETSPNIVMKAEP